jgi:hypothetical protein
MSARQLFLPTTTLITAMFLVSACGAIGGVSGRNTEPPPTLGPPAALAQLRAQFFPGEQMTFELSLRGISGGEANLGVGEPGLVDGRRQIIVSSRVESAGVAAMFKKVRDQVTTSIDLDTGRPVSHHAEMQFGERESVIDTSFADGRVGGFELAYTPRGSRTRHLRQAMPALGALRAWSPADGEIVYLYAVAGRQLWQLTLRMTSREEIETALGRHPALRIDGVARRVTRDLRAEPKKPARDFTVWLSDDENRLPLLTTARTEFGDVKAELTVYARPDGSELARSR